LLDYAERPEDKRDFVFSTEPTWPLKARDLISRLNNISPDRTNLYLRWLKTFLSETQFSRSHLFDPEDEGATPMTVTVGPPVYQSHPCTPIQLAIQISSSKSAPPFRYVIDKQYWDQMDEDQRAGLVVHELIWRELLGSFPHVANSIPVRIMNRFLVSPRLPTVHLQQYIEGLYNLGFIHAQIQNGIRVRLPFCPNEWWSPLFIRFGRCPPVGIQFWNIDTVSSANIIEQDYKSPKTNKLVHLKAGMHRFDRNGEPK
jgi:hypothetical protein